MAKGYYGNAEAVVLNQAPFFNFYMQEQQRKKAENQLLDKQIGDDLARMSPEGMRQQDVPIFLQDYQNLKNLSIQHRDAIRNPAKNPKAWQEYQTAKTRLMGRIAQSKAAKENTKALYDFRAKNLDRLDDDEFKRAMVLYNAPIDSQEHEQVRNFDQSQLIFKAPKMDLVKLYAPINQLKPVEAQETEALPNGQIRKVRTKQISPGAVAQYMNMAYETDLLNSKKGFDDMFTNMPPEELSALEGYAQKHFDPNFKITSPKELAIASGLYGRVDKSVLGDLSGTDLSRREAFQMAQQRRAFAHRDAMDARRAARQEKDDYLWEADTEAALKSGNAEEVRRLASRLDISTPGVEQKFIKEGETKEFAMRRFKRALKEGGVDGKSKYLTPEDFKAGVLVVLVPKVNKDGVRIKDKYGKDEYEAMAVSARDPYLKSRLNKLKTYAQGSGSKPLPDAVFKQEQAPEFDEMDFSPNYYDEQNQ